MALPAGWKAVDTPIESGQAHVYCASHPAFEFRCALKRLKNSARVNRFARELKVMSSLADAGCSVPPVVASDLDADKPWYAMPWYEQGSMQAWLAQGADRPGVEKDLNRLVTLGRAIADVHAQGVAHRDLKPANVLVDEDRLLLTDFGLCLPVEDGSRVTDTLEAVGSRFYIAPENESGIHEELDQRPADFYAFGKICWSVLLRRPPLAREAAIEPENTLVRQLSDGRLAPLDALLRDLLLRDPRARLRDWAIVLRELESVTNALAGREPISVRSPRLAALDAARRLRDLPQVAAFDEGRKENDRADAWKASLRREMSSAARRLELAVGALREALEGMLTLSATTGGAAAPAAFARAHPEMVGVSLLNPSPTDQASVLLLHSQTGNGAFPTLVVRIAAYADDAGDVHLASVPLISGRGQPEALAAPLVPWLARSAGPHPMLRQATLDAAEAFVSGLTDTFVAVAEHYILGIAEGEDPTTTGFWEGFVPQPNAVVTPGLTAGDVTPPDLRSFELLPDRISVAADGAIVACRVRLTDDGAGVAGSSYRSSPSQARLVSPSGQFVDAIFTDRSIVSGDMHDGIFEDDFVLAPAAERGRWTIESMMTVDAVGNTRRYTPTELRELGFTSEVIVR